MRLAIMQPYFFPYLGYFQLMASAQKFVVLDDVNFINRGWINRNRIAVQGEPQWLTIPLVKASQNKLINELNILDEPSWKRKMIRMVEHSYANAPFRENILSFFADLMAEANGSLSPFLSRHLKRIADYLGLSVVLEATSTRYPKEGRAGQERILDICQQEGATSYINPPGGRDLYDAELFRSKGIELFFLESNLASLNLRHGGDAALSILDLMMFNPVSAIREAIASARMVPA